MKVREFEAKAWQIDGIRLVIRASQDAQVKEFPRTNAAQSNKSIKWYQEQIAVYVEGFDFTICSGQGGIPNGKTHIETVRASYARVE